MIKTVHQCIVLFALFLLHHPYVYAGTEYAYMRIATQAPIHKKKKKPVMKKPLAKVTPRIAKDYIPSKNTGKRMREIIEEYKYCMYTETGDRIAFALKLNTSLRADENITGSSRKLGYEVCLADTIGLKRYESRDDIERGTYDELVLVDTPYISVANGVPFHRHYARPWVTAYLVQLAYDMNLHFGGALVRTQCIADMRPLRVTSLIRSYDDQRRQGNSPASCKNEICSTHTTGSAVDISNSAFHVGWRERKWIKERLLADRKKGKIIMIQEFFSAHFHVFVLPPEFQLPQE